MIIGYMIIAKCVFIFKFYKFRTIAVSPTDKIGFDSRSSNYVVINVVLRRQC